ncbi:YaeC family lipoprotein [Cryobacterium roopkundense]|uniref:D-methionine transport system substrate-binding protein n=1 Tax=Cryobacterium roopkundense TaxID=1001240 RepID=A0A099J3X7_9MICO|nr:MetQ/NlpA family ABC transporter substrate-binding protein [Cryobacterium roopkundense]KGJ72113.1 YaeC family lipoprotein [Cryobacterium roopkundense]MBB5643239.1 D-methionine transport system substrate-binding protein [Cryobacterium roopkundense]
MQRRSFLTYALAGVACAGVSVLSGCGLAGGAAASAGKGGASDKTIKLIVTESAPYQEPTKIAQALLEKDGWAVTVKYVTDIIQPNLAVAQQEYDANFFQHGAYLQQFNTDKNLDLVGLFYEYGSPGGIYSLKYTSLDDLPKGAKIALPVDPANNGRALFLLRDAGLITLTKGVDVIHTSQRNITSNPLEFEFVEVDQQSLKQTLPDVDAAFLFVRLAAESNLTAKNQLAFEEDADQIPFRCVVAGRPDFAGTEKALALQAAYQSPEVRAWYEGYIGGILPLPWEEDPTAELEKWLSA